MFLCWGNVGGWGLPARGVAVHWCPRASRNGQLTLLAPQLALTDPSSRLPGWLGGRPPRWAGSLSTFASRGTGLKKQARQGLLRLGILLLTGQHQEAISEMGGEGNSRFQKFLQTLLCGLGATATIPQPTALLDAALERGANRCPQCRPAP